METKIINERTMNAPQRNMVIPRPYGGAIYIIFSDATVKRNVKPLIDAWFSARNSLSENTLPLFDTQSQAQLELADLRKEAQHWNFGGTMRISYTASAEKYAKRGNITNTAVIENEEYAISVGFENRALTNFCVAHRKRPEMLERHIEHDPTTGDTIASEVAVYSESYMLSNQQQITREAAVGIHQHIAHDNDMDAPQRIRMTAICQDVFDVIAAIIYNRPQNPSGSYTINIDEVLAVRGSEKLRDKNGHSKGHDSQNRARVVEAIIQLSNISMAYGVKKNVDGRKTKSGGGRIISIMSFESTHDVPIAMSIDKQLQVTPYETFTTIEIQFGEAFQDFVNRGYYENLSAPAKILSLNAQSEAHVKDCGRFLYQRQDRQDADRRITFTVDEIFSGLHMTWDAAGIAFTIKRFERMLEQVKSHRLILGWRYIDETPLPRNQAEKTSIWRQRRLEFQFPPSRARLGTAS